MEHENDEMMMLTNVEAPPSISQAEDENPQVIAVENGKESFSSSKDVSPCVSRRRPKLKKSNRDAILDLKLENENKESSARGGSITTASRGRT